MSACAPEKSSCYMMPRVNIMEKADEVIIEAELPGVSKDGTQIEVKDNELTLTGHRKVSENDGRIHLRERAQADYRRVFALSRAIDTSRVEAEMKDGVLTLRLPKRDEVKPRRISVN
ncbi:MAG: Hsp20/alpha crystallin family protein [Candidatus Hydrogenedentes bacterium]|nr:Hsp20/alpha crystallin family protein [Candidatus Hydrogenedentota bacterium]